MKIISFKDFKERSQRIPTISTVTGKKGHVYKFAGMGGDFPFYDSYNAPPINTMQEFYDWYVWKIVQQPKSSPLTAHKYNKEYEEYNDFLCFFDPEKFFMFPNEEEYQSKGAIRTLAKRHLRSAKVPRNAWPYLSSSTLVQDVLEAIRDHHEMPGLRGPQVGFYISYDSPQQIAFYL
jgi:hypothetical protein